MKSHSFIDAQPLGEQYYSRWDGVDPLRPKLRRIATPIVTNAVTAMSGKLIVINENNISVSDGNAAFAAIHRSWSDIPRVTQAVRTLGFETPRFPFKREFLDKPVVGGSFHALGGVAVDRKNPDDSVVRIFSDFVNDGQPVAFFSGGTRVKTFTHGTDSETGAKSKIPTGKDIRKVERFRRGIAMLSIATRVDVVPVIIAGNGDVDDRKPYRLGKSLVAVVGARIEPPELDPSLNMRRQLAVVTDFTRQIESCSQDLLDQAYGLRDSL